MDFAIEHEIWKWISPLRNPSSGWISIKKSKHCFHGFPYTNQLGNPKKDLQNILVNSSLHFANNVCKWKTAVLKNSFSNPFWISQSNGKNSGNPKTAISVLKSILAFRIWLQSNIPLIDGWVFFMIHCFHSESIKYTARGPWCLENTS